MSWRNPRVDKSGELLLAGQQVGAPGGLPSYWSENANLALASLVEPTAEEQKAELFQEMVALGYSQVRVVGGSDDSSQGVPGAIPLSWVRGPVSAIPTIEAASTSPATTAPAKKAGRKPKAAASVPAPPAATRTRAGRVSKRPDRFSD
ncbi:MAG: hypothetical protein Q9195_009536 [Heterodermia aff. obscurata]